MLIEDLDRFLPVSCFEDEIASAYERLRKKLAYRRFILDQENRLVSLPTHQSIVVHFAVSSAFAFASDSARSRFNPA